MEAQSWLKLEAFVQEPIKKHAWIALFVCMATKALHLKLVTGLSSSNFIEALKRFIAR
jgi:hypothetical protein